MKTPEQKAEAERKALAAYDAERAAREGQTLDQIDPATIHAARKALADYMEPDGSRSLAARADGLATALKDVLAALGGQR